MCIIQSPLVKQSLFILISAICVFSQLGDGRKHPKTPLTSNHQDVVVVSMPHLHKGILNDILAITVLDQPIFIGARRLVDDVVFLFQEAHLLCVIPSLVIGLGYTSFFLYGSAFSLNLLTFKWMFQNKVLSSLFFAYLICRYFPIQIHVEMWFHLSLLNEFSVKVCRFAVVFVIFLSFCVKRMTTINRNNFNMGVFPIESVPVYLVGNWLGLREFPLLHRIVTLLITIVIVLVPTLSVFILLLILCSMLASQAYLFLFDQS
jgi:hypothetical protein